VSPKALLNIVLALALAGLLALAIYEPGKPEAPEAKRLTALSPEVVEKIRIEIPGRAPVVLHKQSGQWWMQAPLKMRANAGRIQQLLKITQAKSIADYAMSRVDANQLQLDVPSLSLQLDDVLLRFGTTDALGGSRYIQVGNTVHLITDRYSHLAKAAPTDFVSPLLLPEGSVIDELRLPGLRVQQGDGQWLVDGKAADADAVQNLLDEWRHARALRVSVPDNSATNMKSAESVTLTFEKNSSKQTLHFVVRRNDTEIILQRPKLGIQYHFPVEAGQRLLSLPAVGDAAQ